MVFEWIEGTDFNMLSLRTEAGSEPEVLRPIESEFDIVLSRLRFERTAVLESGRLSSSSLKATSFLSFGGHRWLSYDSRGAQPRLLEAGKAEIGVGQEGTVANVGLSASDNGLSATVHLPKELFEAVLAPLAFSSADVDARITVKGDFYHRRRSGAALGPADYFVERQGRVGIIHKIHVSQS